jgi:hypothetical protein
VDDREKWKEKTSEEGQGPAGAVAPEMDGWMVCILFLKILAHSN